jgi:hypothetical protein
VCGQAGAQARKRRGAGVPDGGRVASVEAREWRKVVLPGGSACWPHPDSASVTSVAASAPVRACRQPPATRGSCEAKSGDELMKVGVLAYDLSRPANLNA